jgi:hypothetical protein
MSLGDLLSGIDAQKAGEAVAVALIGAVVKEAAERLGPDKVAAARVVADAVIDHLPVELLRAALDDADVRRAKALKAAADLAAFGTENP